MALGRVKNWIAEVLTASDLNAEFNNILNNPISLISPLTGTLDADGNEIVLDGGGTSSITADTNSRLDLKLNGTDLFKFDGTATTPVNGLQFTAAAAGSEPDITAFGSDTDIDINLVPKGAGSVTVGGVTLGATQIASFTETGDVSISAVTPSGDVWSAAQTLTIPTAGVILLLPYVRIDNASGANRIYNFGLNINSTDYFPSRDNNGTPAYPNQYATIINGQYETLRGFVDHLTYLDIAAEGISTGSQSVRPIVGSNNATATQTLKGTTTTGRMTIVIFDGS